MPTSSRMTFSDMMKTLLTRPDMRWEVAGVSLAFCVVIALFFAHRRPGPTVPPAARAAALQSVLVDGLHLDLLGLEACPRTGIATAEIQVYGVAPGVRNPIAASTLDGAAQEGGVFFGATVAPTTVMFTGAGGEPATGAAGPDVSLAVLRFKTMLPDRPAQLRLCVNGQWLTLRPVLARSVPPFIQGPLSFALGK